MTTSDSKTPSASAPDTLELSEEDKQLDDTLKMLIERIRDPEPALQRAALEALRTQIRSSAVSMTSVPKALKFLRLQFETLVALHETLIDKSNACFLADIISVIAMTAPPNRTGQGLALKYRLLGQQIPVGDEWGHEYVRYLAMEIIEAYGRTGDLDTILPIAREVVFFFLDHNAEPDACDVLYEIGQLPFLVDFLSESTQVSDANSTNIEKTSKFDYNRVCRYLLSCVPYEADGDDRVALEVAYSIYAKVACDAPNALLVALRLNEKGRILEALQMASPHVNGELEQLSYMLARQRISLEGLDLSQQLKSERIQSILNNERLSENFKKLQHDLDVVNPKNPEDIYKTHLQETFGSSSLRLTPTPRQNLASSLVNAFVNAASGLESLLDDGGIDGVTAALKNSKVSDLAESKLTISKTSAENNVEKLADQTMADSLNLNSSEMLSKDLNNSTSKISDSMLDTDEKVAKMEVSETSPLVDQSAPKEKKEAPKKGGTSWIYKCKDHGVISTVASIGMIHMWDSENGLAHLDRYLYSSNINVKAGAILGIGLCHTGTRNDSDPALALLREHLEEEAYSVDTKGKETFQSAALLGLAFAYGGSARDDVAEAVSPLLQAVPDRPLTSPGAKASSSSPKRIETSAMAALALGHIYVGTCNGDVASTILQTMMEAGRSQLDHATAPFLALSLALLFLGKTENEAAVILETLRVIEHPIAGEAATLVKICSYAGSGNVLKIQELLKICTRCAGDVFDSFASDAAWVGDSDNIDGTEKGAQMETDTNEEKDANTEVNIKTEQESVLEKVDNDVKKEETETKQDQSAAVDDNSSTFAVIGIALICMMEDIGKEMSHRLLSHLMQFGTSAVRKAVPLALGLMHASHPVTSVVELLGKYSHDHDKAVAVSAIFAMGLVGGGTNNAKLAQMLRHLSAYYQRDADCLYIVKLAQGLVHAGKGTIAFSPIHSHRDLLSPHALAGLLTVLVAVSDAQPLLLENSSYLVYFLATAMYPRFLVTLDADTLEPIPVLVRVGQAVDVVGQAGKPKTITGFQTHTTPILLAFSERAEMATEEYIPLTPVLESFCLVRRNPQYQPASSHSLSIDGGVTH